MLHMTNMTYNLDILATSQTLLLLAIGYLISFNLIILHALIDGLPSTELTNATILTKVCYYCLNNHSPGELDSVAPLGPQFLFPLVPEDNFRG